MEGIHVMHPFILNSCAVIFMDLTSTNTVEVKKKQTLSIKQTLLLDVKELMYRSGEAAHTDVCLIRCKSPFSFSLFVFPQMLLLDCCASF